MHLKKWAVLVLLLPVLYSCVTNKKVTYLQKDDLHSKDLVTNDSIYRQIEIKDYKYLLQPEDVISITMLTLSPPEYNFFTKMDQSQNSNRNVTSANSALYGYLIDPDGNLEFPVVGKIHLAGLSVEEAQEKIQQLAAEYLEEPVIKIRLMNYRFTIIGEVPSQGNYTTFNTKISVMEAIGMAGGLGELADRSQIKIIRQSGNTADVYYINTLDESFVSSDFYFVKQGDIIDVPPLKQRPFRKYFSQNFALFVTILSTTTSLLILFGVYR